jgi:hypothetical protein
MSHEVVGVDFQRALCAEYFGCRGVVSGPTGQTPLTAARVMCQAKAWEL